jgi:hypothetical protein
LDSVAGYARLDVSHEDAISGIFVSLEGDLKFYTKYEWKLSHIFFE